jgi:hypothetical protein
VYAGAKCKTIKINADTLRALCTVDAKLASGMLTVVARTAMERLVHTRVQLIAAQQGK